MRKDYVIGLDPGASGGITVLSANGEIADSIPMPDTLADMWAFIERYADNSVAYLEKVSAMPGQGVSSMFKFGQQYGYLQMALTAARIPFFDVTPMKWQKALGLLSRKGESKTEHKSRMKGAAQQYFPKTKVTLKNSDSILIAFYGLQEQL